MDSFDNKILSLLMDDGRMTWADLASQVGLSSPAVADRVNRLIKKGIIKGFGTILDPERAGLTCTAFIAVTLEKPEHRAPFLQQVMELDDIQECHHVAGDYDYLLKVRCRNTKDLDRVISLELKSQPGVAKTRTTIVMGTYKETQRLPLIPEQFAKEEGK